MLIVKVFINSHQIAQATATNVSDLAEVSSYDCRSITSPFPDRSAEPLLANFDIADHNRNQTVWALIEKMAARIAELEK